jgi:predicted GTPase
MKSNLDHYTEFVQSWINYAFDKRGKLNIIIIGNTGIGKSTLINEIFEGNLAETGDGRPVTKSVREISREKIPVSIFDTRGFEKENYAEIIEELDNLIEEKRKSNHPQEHIHIAWLCILEDSRRIEDADIKLVEMLSKKIPVVVVITKCISDQGFKKEVERLLPQARNVIQTRAKEIILDDDEVTLPPKNLDKLIELTMELVPESVKNAVAAAQHVNLRIKQIRSQGAVAIFTTSAGVGNIATSLVPTLNISLPIAVQVAMIIAISTIWGLPITKTFIISLVFGAAATMAVPNIANALLKLIPGIGTAVGSTVDPALTAIVGEAYIATLTVLSKRNPNRLSTEKEIKIEFYHQLQDHLKLFWHRLRHGTNL